MGHDRGCPEGEQGVGRTVHDHIVGDIVNDRRFPADSLNGGPDAESWDFHIKMLLSCLTCPSVISIVSKNREELYHD
jgi:hypothetical protein